MPRREVCERDHLSSVLWCCLSPSMFRRVSSAAAGVTQAVGSEFDSVLSQNVFFVIRLHAKIQYEFFF